MTDDLGPAYQRLAAAQRVPLDATARIERRVRARRRRRRASLAVAAAVLVAGTTGVALGTGDAAPPPAPRTDTATDSASPAPPPPPPAPDVDTPPPVTCPTGWPTRIDLDHPGHDLLVDLLGEWSEQHGGYVLDESAGRMVFLRADGTAHADVTYRRSGPRWYPGALSQCSDSTRSQTSAAGQPLPGLAAVDLVGCLRDGDTSVHADVTDPFATEGTTTPTQAIARLLGPNDHPLTLAVDGSHVLAWVREPNDAVVLAQTLVASDDGRWHVSGLAGCGSALPGLPPAKVATPVVELTVGHCWVEALTHDGRAWLPPYADQLGAGGPLPEGFVGIGTAEVRGDELRYRDVSGAEVGMVPADDPRAAIPVPTCR